MMNKAQAEELFRNNAVLFGDHDGIPMPKAVELLGDKAVQFIAQMERNGTHPGCYRKGYGNGEYTAMYLSSEGFFAAVTWNNINELQQLYKFMKEGDA